MPDRKSDETEALNEEARRIWNLNAEWWDAKIGGEGNEFHRTLISPATERLLNLQPHETVLDCACGNGQFSRRMAQLGAKVVAFDFSEKFLDVARQRTVEGVEPVEYHLIDATQESQLLALGSRRFDAAVCNMALMDMAEIEPLVSATSQLLKPNGRFVFSVLHPGFNSSHGCKMVVEEEDREGELVTTYSVKVSHYIRPSVVKGLGIVGQPAAHYYFHRPLSVLFNTFFQQGFVLDSLEEPTFDGRSAPNRPFSWENFKEIPPALVARMRLLSAAETGKIL